MSIAIQTDGATQARASAFMISRVPAISAQTLALCRIVFGGLLLYFWLQYDPADLQRLATVSRPLPLASLLDTAGTLTALANNPGARTALYWTIAALTLAFTAGIFARIAFGLLTVSLWLAAMLMHMGHFITPLLLGMTATMFAPWGAAWSVDALRNPSTAKVASPLYGYAPWLLGLSIGLAYAAAGLTKLLRTNGAWLWDTGARNGFLQDVPLALTDLGIWISDHYVLALIASVFSSFGQIAYVAASFTGPRIKYAICFFIALPFLVGLVLTMGLFWWPWGLLILILYLPWRRINARISAAPHVGDFPAEASGQRAWFLFATSALIGLHVFAVAIGREYEPLYSNYPMYAVGMRAGSADEADLISKFTQAKRNQRATIHLMLSDGSDRDVTTRHRVAWFLQNARLYASPHALLRRQDRACSAAVAIEPRTIAVRYSVERLMINDGRTAWEEAGTRVQPCP